MQDAQTLDLQAIGHLYRGHHQWLVKWLRRRLGCPHHADDLAHDTFARVLTRREALYLQPGEGGGRALLSTIAHGLMVDHLRRAALERAFAEALALQPEPLAPSAEERLMLFETLLAVDRLLDGLPAKVRQAFLLSQVDGLPYAQIAAEMGVSLSSVQQYMTRAFSACYAARQHMALQ